MADPLAPLSATPPGPPATGGEMDPIASTAALIGALRGMQRPGQWLAALGDPVLGQVGKQMDTDATEMGQLGQHALAQAMQQQQFRAKQAQTLDLTNQQREIERRRADVQEARYEALARIGQQNADTRSNTPKTVKDALGRPYAIYPDDEHSVTPINGDVSGGPVGGGSGFGSLVPGMSDEAAIAAADKYHKLGTIEGTARGVPGMIQQNHIKDLERKRWPNTDLAQSNAEYKTALGSLGPMQKQYNTLQAFENMMGANLDKFLEASKKVPDVGVQPVNHLLRKTYEMFGATSTTDFNARRQAIVTEAARIIENPNLTGVLTNEAQRALSVVAEPNATAEQLMSAAGVLRDEARNRPKFMKAQMDELTRTIGQKALVDYRGEGVASPPPPAAPPPQQRPAASADPDAQYFR